MVVKDFIVDKQLFDKRRSSILQHKLRVVLKCYTIKNFVLNEDKTFTFIKTQRVQKIQFDDPNPHEGFYSIEDSGQKNYKLIVNVIK